MKGLDYAIKRVVQKHNIPEVEARKIIMEFWDATYKKIVKGDNTATTVRHVGTFTFSRYKLNNLVEKTKKKIEFYKNSTKYTEEKRTELIESEIKKLAQAEQRLSEITEQHKEAMDALINARNERKKQQNVEIKSISGSS